MKEPWDTLLQIIIAVFIMVIIFGSMTRAGLITQSFTTNEICKLELGENWAYDYNRKFGSTCIELDYITLDIVNRTEYDFDSNEIIKKYCISPPGFFQLNRWDNGCDDALGEKDE